MPSFISIALPWSQCQVTKTVNKRSTSWGKETTKSPPALVLGASDYVSFKLSRIIFSDEWWL